MSEQIKLGTLISGDCPGRDAVHVAVFPAVSEERLSPADNVALTGKMHDGFYIVRLAEVIEKPIGIVDPFLSGDVRAGDAFYVCLMPGSVTGLRHVYQCPGLRVLPEKML